MNARATRLSCGALFLLLAALAGCTSAGEVVEPSPSPLVTATTRVVPVTREIATAAVPQTTIEPAPSPDPSQEPSIATGPERAGAAPHARAGHNLVYDTSREQLLLLNGQGGEDVWEEVLRGLWAWDGSRWELLDNSAELRPRILAGAAYDAARQRLVLYGGATLGDFTQMDDTWEWDGSAWRQIEVPGPGARDHTVMVYDEARAEIVLYGGIRVGAGDMGDTWRYDGSGWELAADSGPGPRSHHTMVYDAARQQVLLFGGSPGPLGDTWAWDGSEWWQVADSGPAPRSGARMAYDAAREVVILTGGQARSGDGYDDTWVWDGKTWVERPDGPGARDLHDMAYDAARERVILFGGSIWNGQAAEYFGDTWEWDGSSWRELSPARSTD